MKRQLKLVEDFHNKFHQPVLNFPSLIPKDRSDNRYKLMKDETDEYLEGVCESDLPNVAKELVDILYAVYGTILEHGLQDNIEEVFEEVHRSNMSKDYHEYKMIKGPNYFTADVGQFFVDKSES